MSRTCSALVILFGVGAANAQQYVISTVAGGAPPPISASATNTFINSPESIATDAAGNVYFFSNSYCVFKLDTSGTLTRIAGNGRPGYSGDGGPATSAQFSWGASSAVAVDSHGNLFVSDTSRVRRIAPNGIITTVAGNGDQGYSGDGGPAVRAGLDLPSGLAVDGAGNLYIADGMRIRKVSPAGIMTTIGGTGKPGYSGDGGPAINAQFNFPGSMAFDAQGNLFIADSTNNRVRKISTDGIITTVAGGGSSLLGDGGPATGVILSKPTGVGFDAQGNLLIVEEGANRVRMVTPAGMITTIAGNPRGGFSGDGGPATSAQLGYPIGVAADAHGNVYIADSGTHRIRKISNDGIIHTVAGGGAIDMNGAATALPIGEPNGIALDAQGNLFVGDSTNQVIWKVAPGGTMAVAAGNGACSYSGDAGPATQAAICGPREWRSIARATFSFRTPPTIESAKSHPAE